MSSGSPRERRPKAFNLEQWRLLKELAAAGGALPASVLFGRIRREAVGSPAGLDVLAAEAMKLERIRLVRHDVDGRGRLAVALTGAGWRTVSGVRARAAAAAIVAAGPAVVSCATSSAPAAALPEYGARPIPALSAVQRIVDGRAVWSICAAGECERPTPKTVVFGAPSGIAADSASPQGPRAVSAAAAVEQPSAGAPSVRRPQTATPGAREPVVMAAYSVFFATGKDAPFAADLGYVAAAAAKARESGGRVMVVGMTDATGPQAVNTDLAHRRAQRVQALLAEAGVPKDRIWSQADISASRPVPANAQHRAGASGHAVHRRVDVVVMSKPGDSARTFGTAAQIDAVAARR